MVDIAVMQFHPDILGPKWDVFDIYFECPFIDGSGSSEISIEFHLPFGVPKPLAVIESVFVDLLFVFSALGDLK